MSTWCWCNWSKAWLELQSMSGELTDVKIMDGGSNYTVGDVLTVTGTAPQQLVSLQLQLRYSILIITSVTLSIYVVLLLKVLIVIINSIELLVSVQLRKLLLESRFPVTGFSTTGIGATVLGESICHQ